VRSTNSRRLPHGSRTKNRSRPGESVAGHYFYAGGFEALAQGCKTGDGKGGMAVRVAVTTEASLSVVQCSYWTPHRYQTPGLPLSV
jgi:hypothetical protein